MAITDLTGRGTPDLSGLGLALQKLIGPSEEEKLQKALKMAVIESLPNLQPDLMDENQLGAITGMTGLSPDIVRALGQKSSVDEITDWRMGREPDVLDESIEAKRERIRADTARSTADVSIAGAEGQEADLKSRFFKAYGDSGGPEDEARSAMLELQVKDSNNRLTLEAAEAYNTYIASLPPALRGRAAAAFANPNHVEDLNSMERNRIGWADLDLRERMFKFEQTVTSGGSVEELLFERYKMKVQMIDDMNDLIDRGVALSQDSSRHGELNFLIDTLEQRADDFNQIFSEDPFFAIEAKNKLFSNLPKGFVLESVDPEKIKDENMSMLLVNGNATPAQLLELLQSGEITQERFNRIVANSEAITARMNRDPLWESIRAFFGGSLNTTREPRESRSTGLSGFRRPDDTTRLRDMLPTPPEVAPSRRGPGSGTPTQ